jgi:hypothetical protein
VRLMVRPNQFIYVQTVGQGEGFLCEFYASLVTSLLMKNIELKEM